MRRKGFKGLFLVLLVLLLLIAALPPPVEALALRGERQIYTRFKADDNLVAYAEIIQLEITPRFSILSSLEPSILYPQEGKLWDGVEINIDVAFAFSLENKRNILLGIKREMRGKNNAYYVAVSFPWRR